MEAQPPPPSVTDDQSPLEPATGAKPRKWLGIWPRKPKEPPRHILLRLFGLKVWGAVKLVLMCVLVGFVMLAVQFDPASPQFGARQAIGALWTNLVATARWAATNFWKPALVGASVVLPIWVLWRLVTLPFRR